MDAAILRGVSARLGEGEMVGLRGGLAPVASRECVESDWRGGHLRECHNVESGVDVEYCL